MNDDLIYGSLFDLRDKVPFFGEHIVEAYLRQYMKKHNMIDEFVCTIETSYSGVNKLVEETIYVDYCYETDCFHHNSDWASALSYIKVIGVAPFLKLRIIGEDTAIIKEKP